MEDSQLPSHSSSHQEQHHVASFETSDDLYSCLVTLLTFCFFLSVVLILGVFGRADFVLGPNCSRILQVNSFFVQDIKVKIVGESQQNVMLYGFYKPPPLDVQVKWSEAYNVSIPDNFHKEWVYYLHEQAQINVSYAIRSNVSQPLILVIAQGTETLYQWIENPSQSNIALSWNLINGYGVIHQKLPKSTDYYVAIANLNQQEMEVQFNFRIQTSMYNTTGAYYKCSLSHSSCNMNVYFLRKNTVIITTPGPQQGSVVDEWHVNISYEPRWLAYFVGSGILTIAVLLLFKMLIKLLVRPGNGVSQSHTDFQTERNPLLNKEDDAISLGSSYDSVSYDGDEDIEENLDASPKKLNEGEADKTRVLCTVCYDAKRDSFFLPCGHCATCFTCGIRIADEAGTCPICRRRMKKVRKIFTV